MKKFIFLSLICSLCQPLKAQTFNNTYEDTKTLTDLLGDKPSFTILNYKIWKDILSKYIPQENQISGDAAVKYLQTNPFFGTMMKNATAQDTSVRISNLSAAFTFETLNKSFTTFQSTNSTESPSNFSTPMLANALTNLIIERAKEELTASFFQNLKTELQREPELIAAFPKTTTFIGQIQSYMYASFLPALRQAFFTDINNLPYNLGNILRTPRMKLFMQQYPKTKDVWLAIPVLQFLGDMHQGKSIIDATKDIYPDKELYDVDPAYYKALKFTVILSESIRDPSGAHNWVSASDLKSCLDTEATKDIFLGLLYESTKYALVTDGNVQIVNNYIKNDNAQIEKIKTILNDFAANYNSANDLYGAYQSIKATVQTGQAITLQQAIVLINAASENMQTTIDAINQLAPTTEKYTGKADIYFKDLSKLLIIAGDFDQKNYASGVMNTMLLLNQYIGTKAAEIKPFENQAYVAAVNLSTPNLKNTLQVTLLNLITYQAKFPTDNKIAASIKDLTKAVNALNSSPDKDQVDAINVILKSLNGYSYKPGSDDFDEGVLYQKLLKYSTLMASLSEAKTSADATAAIDAAILPVGSSSIKHYTSLSLSLNSYIGGAYYASNYNVSATADKLKFNTLGVALPIGLNLSFTTRWNEIGAISAFVSVVDLGAVASYRLNNPANSDTQTLPAFTFQNLLAPGGFIVLNRLFNTPLAIGFGAQRAPQLSNITTTGAELTLDPKWRFGAFLSVDIPLFELYSKALKKPLNDSK